MAKVPEIMENSGIQHIIVLIVDHLSIIMVHHYLHMPPVLLVIMILNESYLNYLISLFDHQRIYRHLLLNKVAVEYNENTIIVYIKIRYIDISIDTNLQTG